MNFRWQGKYLLLTYPRSDFSLDDCLQFLRTRAKSAVYITVAHELHDDGTPHRHALLVFDRRFSFENERRFDFADRHCNIRGRVDSPSGAYAYVRKEGREFVEWGVLPDFESAGRKGRGESRNELWGRLLDEATDACHFLQLVREASPFDFCTRWVWVASTYRSR